MELINKLFRSISALFTGRHVQKIRKLDGYKELDKLSHKVLDQDMHSIKQINRLDKSQIGAFDEFKSFFLITLEFVDVKDILASIKKSPEGFYFLHIKEVNATTTKIFLIDESRTQVLLENASQIISISKNGAVQYYLAQIVATHDKRYLIDSVKFSSRLANKKQIEDSDLVRWLIVNAIDEMSVVSGGHSSNMMISPTSQDINFTNSYAIDFLYILMRKKVMANLGVGKISRREDGKLIYELNKNTIH